MIYRDMKTDLQILLFLIEEVLHTHTLFWWMILPKRTASMSL